MRRILLIVLCAAILAGVTALFFASELRLSPRAREGLSFAIGFLVLAAVVVREVGASPRAPGEGRDG